MTDVTLTSAFILGLMGAGHCIGMCGGIISALSISTTQTRGKWIRVTSYQIGRITSYAVFGLSAGWVGHRTNQLIALPILPILSGILLILMGCYISRFWLGLTYLESAGKLLWNYISPLSKRFLPVTTSYHALLLGAIWGWLPCGLVYTSLGYAMTLAEPIESAIFMMAFGAGTLPATLLAGTASAHLKKWLNQRAVRLSSAAIFVGLGIYTLIQVFQAGHHAHH